MSELKMTIDKDDEEESEASKTRRDKLRDWIKTRRSNGDKKVEHIQVPDRDPNDDTFDTSRTTMEDASTSASNSNDALIFQIDSSEDIPDWLRQKQEEAAERMKQLEQSVQGETDVPEWLEKRQEELTQNIRQKQKELFTKAARGEMYVPGFSTLHGDDTLHRDDINEEDEPEWVTEQKQTMEADSWIRRKEEENLLEDKRKELQAQSEREILEGTPDWYKQKEAEIMAKLEQMEEEATTAPASDPTAKVIEEHETIDQIVDIINDDGDKDEGLADDWLLTRESAMKEEATRSSNEEVVVAEESDTIPDWLKQKEQEMMQKIQSMENDDAKKSEKDPPKENVSDENRRKELMEVVSSFNPDDGPSQRRDEESLRDDASSSNFSPSSSTEKSSMDSTFPDTPFFRDNVDTEIKPVAAGETLGREGLSVINSTPDWLVDEMESKSTSPWEEDYSVDTEDEYDEKDLDEEFEDSYMFRDPSLDWIRSDPSEFRIEKSSTFSNFQYRYDQMLNTDRALSVEELNTLFEEDENLLKLQAKNQPDCAYGAIFRLEGALIDTTKLQMAAWTKVAEMFDFNPPYLEEVAVAQMMPPDQAIRRAFYWTQDMLESREMAMEHYDALQEVFDDIIGSETDANDQSEDVSMDNFPITEGAIEWLKNLTTVDLPCCVVSNLDRSKLDSVLNMTGLDSFFPEDRRISANDGYDEQEQEFLGAALRNKRRPDHCVVFEATPEAALSAHEVDMRAIALMGLHAMYELRSADMVVEDYAWLSVIDIRRLFWNANYEPELQLERVAATDDKPKRIKRWVDWDYEY